MISFTCINNLGRLGNQLFQYAFLRLTAERLNVKFYYPAWSGDEVFLLDDKDERAEEPLNIDSEYREPPYFGFNEDTRDIKDGCDIMGFFQTERYLDREKVKRWYTFKEEKISGVREKYKGIDFSESAGMHLRFGDKISAPGCYALYITPPPSYCIKAISKLRRRKNILIFSDNPDSARGHIGGLKGNIIYIEGNKDHEDLYP